MENIEIENARSWLGSALKSFHINQWSASVFFPTVSLKQAENLKARNRWRLQLIIWKLSSEDAKTKILLIKGWNDFCLNQKVA